MNNNAVQSFLNPDSLETAIKAAELIAKSNLCPAAYKGNAADVLIAGQMSAELGIPWMQGLQGIAVIKGRPSVWGDLALALVRRHPDFEWIEENYDEDRRTATCVIKRKSQDRPVRQSFSWAEACMAGLFEKDTYQKYRRRMLQMRARSWCMRDALPEALCGMMLAEEARHIPSEEEQQEREQEKAEAAETVASAAGVGKLDAVLQLGGPKAESEQPPGSAEWWTDMIRGATTPATLEKVGMELRAEEPSLREDLRDVYESQRNRLEAEAAGQQEVITSDGGVVDTETGEVSR